jgi:hypothetical protein
VTASPWERSSDVLDHMHSDILAAAADKRAMSRGTGRRSLT